MKPTIPQPSTAIAHSLPPKPPRRNSDHQESKRERKQKSNRDRPGRHRDNRPKDRSSDRQASHQKPNEEKQRDRPRNRSSPDKRSQNERKEPDVPEELPREQPPTVVRSPSTKSVDGPPGDKDTEKQAQKQASLSPAKAVSDEIDWEWEAAAIFAEPDMAYSPDEVGVPLRGIYDEGVLMPRKWDASCVDSDFVKADNLEEFVKNIRKTKSWPMIQFDPAFAINGHLSNGNALSTLTRRQSVSVTEESELCDKKGKDRKHRRSEEQADDGGPMKRLKPDAASVSGRRASTEGEPSDRPRRNSHQSLGDNNHSRQDHRERSQTADARPVSQSRGDTVDQRASGHRMERRSSVSSDSSDLSPLEAELLGRSTKKRTLSDRDRRRRESNRVQRVRRRRPETDSAYR